jgi:hypothetical protein
MHKVIEFVMGFCLPKFGRQHIPTCARPAGTSTHPAHFLYLAATPRVDRNVCIHIIQKLPKVSQSVPFPFIWLKDHGLVASIQTQLLSDDTCSLASARSMLFGSVCVSNVLEKWEIGSGTLLRGGTAVLTHTEPWHAGNNVAGATSDHLAPLM